MNARISGIARNLQRRNSLAAATSPPSNAEISAAPVGDQPRGSSEHQVLAPVEVASGDAHTTLGDTHTSSLAVVIPPGALVAIEIASSGSKVVGGEVEVARVVEGRATKDAAEEEENTKHLKDLVAWWKQAREDLKTPSSKVAEMEGEKLNPDWAILARNSVLRTHVGQGSFELCKACFLEHDQVLLAQTAIRGQKIRELQEGLDRARAKEKEALEAKVVAETRIAALEAQLSATLDEGKKKIIDALESGRNEGFSTGLLAGKTEGITQGRNTFLQSEEYRKSLASARLQGARDFLKAPAFKMAVDFQSARFLNEGFDKCISQIQHL
ncbi:hypothetical protein Salat_2666300 [Sesamum alatum]|uniref:Uncharacterized protein n=1 Tax=Sesamum alatum TaxID=300844 RepID=A0AAE1XQ65_9LAMI|nr:hypothetical protein Salat_2666300 [Sesamum alatum]